MKITGKLKEKFETIQVSEKFCKREFVITDENSMYPQHIKLELKQDKCSIIDPFKIGDIIECSINILGREWVNPQGEVRYFNTLEAWRIEGGQAVQEVQPAESEDDDLPF